MMQQGRRSYIDAKRLVDITAAAGLLIVGAPLCVVVGIAIKLEDGGPVLFRQARVGRGGRLFTLIKLRSMRLDAEAESGPRWAALDDARATRIGRFIRATRIDEIPQAWNVLRGEMSFVGPRPERLEFVRILRDEIPGYDRRHLLRPGLTGWAQVNQRYSGTVDDARVKHAYDLEYIERHSLRLDARILLRTVHVICSGWGSGARGPARAVGDRSVRTAPSLSPPWG
jgi:lipopolysaccharide/colanic/teichoic acid biosynthesis glycosyltransferase